MESTEFSQLESIFADRYGSSIRLDVNRQTHDIYGYSPGSMVVFAGKLEINLSAQFYYSSYLSRFIRDLHRVQTLEDEEKIRASNPAVQQAWEEYQLLLKLSK